MTRHLLQRVAHGGEVMHGIPAVKQDQVLRELRPLFRRDGKRQCVQPAFQQFQGSLWQHQATLLRKNSSSRPTGRPVPPFGVLPLKALPAMSRCAQG